MPILDFLYVVSPRDALAGQPLYAYLYAPERVAALAEELHRRLRRGLRDRETAAAFVLWAVERIRSTYQEGALTWKWVFDGLGLPEDRNQACDLVLTGLGYFQRQLKRSDNGNQLYLFTLLAEGGVPEAMLRQGNSIYRRVVLGLLDEIKREGGSQLDAETAIEIAARRTAYLPDVFHNREAAATLAGLALALAALRQALPEGLPAAAAVAWLDANRAGWRQDLPLRLSADALKALVIPALQASRSMGPGGEPAAGRELRLGANGEWMSFRRIATTGWLDTAALPGARGLNLRLIGGAVHFYGAWETSGWTLSRSGRDEILVEAPLDAPFSLKAYADGEAKGEAIIETGLPLAGEAPTFWRPAPAVTSATCDRLLPLQGRPRTPAPTLWLLAALDAQASAEPGLTLGEARLGAGGKLWPLQGAGRLRVGGESFEVATGADVSEKAHALEAVGPAFAGWRLPSGAPIFHGRPTLRGAFPGSGVSRPLREGELKWQAAAGLGGEFVAWIERAETLARLKIVSLPSDAGLEARETAAGGLKLTAKGLGDGRRLALRSGERSAHATLVGGATEIVLPAPAAAPAMINLHLSDVRTGATLDLVAPWPARRGMLLSPSGERLERDAPLSIEELTGWRAVAPVAKAKIMLRAQGGGAAAIGVSDEYPLILLAPPIRSMLALGGPDAQVDLSLVVDGFESRRLQIRRYRDAARLDGDWLKVGVSREGEGRGRARLFDGGIDVHIHAVEIESGPGREKQIVAKDLNLRELLGDDGGLWMVLPRFQGRIQRPVVWSPRPLRTGVRADRIAAYAQEWKRLTSEAEIARWRDVWSRIERVQRHADVGCLDRVQALAAMPRAVIKQAYLVAPDKLADHLALDHAAPFLWAAIPLGEFVAGLRAAVDHVSALLASLGDAALIRRHAADQAISRSQTIAVLRPELAAHIGHGLSVLQLLDHLPPSEQLAVLARFSARPSPLQALQSLAQLAVQKSVETPAGVAELSPLKRPPRMEFESERQRLVDAPLVLAEAALGRRPPLTRDDMLTLVLVRMCDIEFFDRAVPAAIQLAVEEK